MNLGSDINTLSVNFTRKIFKDNREEVVLKQVSSHTILGDSYYSVFLICMGHKQFKKKYRICINEKWQLVHKLHEVNQELLQVQFFPKTATYPP